MGQNRSPCSRKRSPCHLSRTTPNPDPCRPRNRTRTHDVDVARSDPIFHFIPVTPGDPRCAFRCIQGGCAWGVQAGLQR
eukprot:3071417-Prymnesium_polylepis.1